VAYSARRHRERAYRPNCSSSRQQRAHRLGAMYEVVDSETNERLLKDRYGYLLVTVLVSWRRYF